MPKKNQLKNGGPTHYEESQVEVVEKVINKDNKSIKKLEEAISYILDENEQMKKDIAKLMSRMGL
jgi:predicted RNase H-like nuclease (RuvC/YqgF family)|tara:strand:- start:21231 stop:21425 length:195 start_codon:yes stop_codon:yes gene_type:complete